MALLKRKSDVIDASLKDFLPPRGSSAYAEINDYYEMLWDYNLRGGKRLRPALVFFSCEMFGGDSSKAIPSAVALELMHNFLLVHDDIQDASELRRGKPTLHKIYGEGSAINAGDGLFARTWSTLNANRKLIGATKTLRIFKEFAEICNYTVEGQALEMGLVRKGRWDLSEVDYYKLVELKTAHYTTTYPLRIGAIVAGAPAKDIKAFNAFGKPFGTAFQIQDDLLNLVGEEGKYGKEIAGDIYEGKRTLPLIHLFRKCNAKEREALVSIMNKPRSEKTEEDVQLVLTKMKEKGSIDYAREKMTAFAKEAKAIFEKKFAHVAENDGKRAIKLLIDYVVERQV
jgi:geranylgeranyl diphosphate synthase type II